MKSIRLRQVENRFRTGDTDLLKRNYTCDLDPEA